MFLHPNSAPLWREYLLFTQSYFSTFTVSKVNAAYGKCLSTLSAVRDGSMVSHPALPGIEEDMLGNRFCLDFTRTQVDKENCFCVLKVFPVSFPSVQISSSNNVISCVSLATQRRRFLCSRLWLILHFSNLTMYENCPQNSRYTDTIKYYSPNSFNAELCL